MIAQGLRALRFADDRVLDDTEGMSEEIAKGLSSPPGEGQGEEGRSWGGRNIKPSPKGRGRK
jgi:hypothetical protein